MHALPVLSHIVVDSPRTNGMEVLPGDEPRTLERELMQIPEPPPPRDDAVPGVPGSHEEPRVETGDLVAPTESPTVYRGSSSSARRRLEVVPAPPSPPSPLPVPGDLVDTFLIEEAIGVGGMGASSGHSIPSSIARSRSSCCPPIRPAIPRSSRGSTRKGARPRNSITRTSHGCIRSVRTGHITISPSSTSKG